MIGKETKEQESIIVVVEDNSNDARFLLKAFDKLGRQNNVVILKDGAEAIDFLLSGSANGRAEKTQVMFLDINLPKVDGLEVLGKIKSDQKTKHIPVVVLTSSTQDSDIKASIELGANSYIVKPIEFKTYMEQIQKICDYWCNLNRQVLN